MITYIHENLMKLDLCYLDLSGTHTAYRNCIKHHNNFVSKHEETIEKILLEILPHGSGIDAKWDIEISETKPIIVCSNSYHRMNDAGYYDGWYDFSIVLDTSQPGSLSFDKVRGKLDHDTKDYIGETIDHGLNILAEVYQAKRLARNSFGTELFTLARETIEKETAERNERESRSLNSGGIWPVVKEIAAG